MIFLGVLAWSFAVFRFFAERLDFPIEIADFLEKRNVVFGFVSSMLLAASLYTYLVHWHFRWWMGPCLVRAFWGILYMIPILNLFISKEAKEDISYAWKNMFKEEYKWEVNLFDFFGPGDFPVCCDPCGVLHPKALIKKFPILPKNRKYGEFLYFFR